MKFEIENEIINQYLHLLSDDVPDFLYEYANVPELKRLKGISMISACESSKLIPVNFFHNRYEHSIGVALIVWNFTKDKKQTIAGLYHDIATPSFSHVIDYLHGDYEKQEYTEGFTEKAVRNSKEIMALLKRDNINVDEIKDYHIYTIADNDTPKLSADRLEYSLSDGLTTQDAFTLESINRIYEDLKVIKNEQGEDELGFGHIEIAEEYVEGASKLWQLFSGNPENCMVMHFWKDILKLMISQNYISENDLYNLSEMEIADIIKNGSNKVIANAFEIFSKSERVERSDILLEDKYCVPTKTKKRYNNPLVQINENGEAKRIYDISQKGKRIIDGIKDFQDSKYSCLNIKFK